MSDQLPVDAAAGAEAVARHRRHRPPGDGRSRQVQLRLDDREYGDLAAAAQRAGLTPTGYAAAAALAAARGSQSPGAPVRAVAVELLAIRASLRMIGSNINQLAAAANAGAMPPTAQLVAYGDRVLQIVARVDTALADVRRRLM
jgi:hypothetical protein